MSFLCHTFLAEISYWSHCHYKQEKLQLSPSVYSQCNLAYASSSTRSVVLYVHRLCTVRVQQLTYHCIGC